jgi:hypothetical protein
MPVRPFRNSWRCSGRSRRGAVPLNVPRPPLPDVTSPNGRNGYLSGHLAFSAAAMVLKAAIGSDTFGMSVTIPAGSSTVEPRTDTQAGVPAAPVTLSWKSFTAAADQAGISREYGGIHFNDGDFEARQAGEDVGLLVWSKAKSYFNGKAIPKT